MLMGVARMQTSLRSSGRCRSGTRRSIVAYSTYVRFRLADVSSVAGSAMNNNAESRKPEGLQTACITANKERQYIHLQAIGDEWWWPVLVTLAGVC